MQPSHNVTSPSWMLVSMGPLLKASNEKVFSKKYRVCNWDSNKMHLYPYSVLLCNCTKWIRIASGIVLETRDLFLGMHAGIFVAVLIPWYLTVWNWVHVLVFIGVCLHRKFGVEAELVTPSQCKELWPLLRTDDLVVWRLTEMPVGQTHITLCMHVIARPSCFKM